MLDTHPSRQETEFARRAVYAIPANVFKSRRPAVPAHVFAAECERAFADETPSCLIDLDLGERLGLAFTATTPYLLARYIRIRAGESLATELTASGEIHYAIKGSGESSNKKDTIAWREGDIFCFPGGAKTEHKAGRQDAVLLQFTDEPLYSFVHARPLTGAGAAIETVHYFAEAIAHELDKVYQQDTGEEASGMAVQFVSNATRHLGTCLPTTALAVNSLMPGKSQRAHIHNAVALTLCIQGERCYSMIDGMRVDWQANAVMVTPPTAAHSHHNEGDKLMKSLIAQDGGLFYHARAVGFSFVD